jgi:hypothetical protein
LLRGLATPSLPGGFETRSPRQNPGNYWANYMYSFERVALGLLASGSGFSSRILVHLVVTLPALIAGTTLGIILFGRVDQASFRRVTLAILFAGGVALVV